MALQFPRGCHSAIEERRPADEQTDGRTDRQEANSIGPSYKLLNGRTLLGNNFPRCAERTTEPIMTSPAGWLARRSPVAVAINLNEAARSEIWTTEAASGAKWLSKHSNWWRRQPGQLTAGWIAHSIGFSAATNSVRSSGQNSTTSDSGQSRGQLSPKKRWRRN